MRLLRYRETMKSSRVHTPGRSKPLVLGLTTFAKISAIQGIHLPAASRTMFAGFERHGLSDEQRRQAIAKRA